MSLCFKFLFSKNKVSGVLKDLLGSIPQDNLKYEFTTFIDKLVCTYYIFLIKTSRTFYNNLYKIHFSPTQLNLIVKV